MKVIAPSPSKKMENCVLGPRVDHPALKHLRTIFQPTDTICIGVMHPARGMDQRFFVLSEFLADADKRLQELTAANRDSSIFICMNPVKAGPPVLRNRDCVGEIRTTYIDIDKNGLVSRDALMSDVFAGKLPEPTFLLETSPQKFQIIWKVEGLTRDQQEALNRGLVRDYNGDKASTDCVRFLRLPGFANVKPEYLDRPIVTLIHQSESVSHREHFSTLDDVLPPKKARSAASSKFEELFDYAGWAPLERAMGVDLEEGAQQDCPFHDHTQPGNFGIIRDNDRLVHCFGTGHGPRNAGKHTWDLVGAFAAFYGIRKQYDAARRICEEGRTLDSSFPTFESIFEKADPLPHADLIDVEAFKEEKRSWIFENIREAHDELSDKPQSWVLENFILEHGLHLFSGKPGAMKSMLAMLVAKSAVSAESFLGRANVGRPINVVYVDRENPESEVRKRCAALGLLHAPNFRVWGDWREDGPPPIVMDDPRLVESARRDNALFIFDSLSSYLDGADENSSGEMMVLMSKARSLARMSSGVIVLHHSPKNGPASARGAGAIAASTDMALLVSKENATVTLSEERFRPCAGYVLKFRMDFGVGTGGQYSAHLVQDTQGEGFSNKASSDAQQEKKNDEEKEGSNDFYSAPERLQRAAKIIRQAYDRCQPIVSKGQLCLMLGISEDSKFAREYLNGRDSNPWTCVPNGRSTAFLPKDVIDMPRKTNPPKSGPARDAVVM